MAKKAALALPAWSGRHFVGIDENGMGPRLGPLVVTSVLVSSRPDDEKARKLALSRPRGAIAGRIGDSKKLVAFEDSALGEAWARALALRAAPDQAAPRTPAELLERLTIDEARDLRAPCPPHHVDLCWSDDGEAFVSDDAAVSACARDLDRLAARGLEVARARVAVICTRRLNEAVDRGLSRFDVDLHTMERLTLAARQDAGDDVYALCGKVGGFDFYAPRLGPLAGHLHTTLVEGRARSEYSFPGLGRMAFIRDADESNLVVGLASLVGKWVRDHLTRRVIRYHQVLDPDLPVASGYHDPVTTKFIEASALVRKKRRIEAACFERDSLGKREAAASPSSGRRSPSAQQELLGR